MSSWIIVVLFNFGLDDRLDKATFNVNEVAAVEHHLCKRVVLRGGLFSSDQYKESPCGKVTLRNGKVLYTREYDIDKIAQIMEGNE